MKTKSNFLSNKSLDGNSLYVIIAKDNQEIEAYSFKTANKENSSTDDLVSIHEKLNEFLKDNFLHVIQAHENMSIYETADPTLLFFCEWRKEDLRFVLSDSVEYSFGEHCKINEFMNRLNVEEFHQCGIILDKLFHQNSPSDMKSIYVCKNAGLPD